MQLHFHANILFLIYKCNSFYAITFSCKYIDPNLVVFMQLHFRANILIVLI